MASVVKCLGTMAIGSFIGAAGSAYYLQKKMDKAALAVASAHAKDGKIPIGGQTKDGKMWDGSITVDEFKKQLDSKTKKISLIRGAMGSLGATLIAAITLLMRGKVKVK